MGQMNSTSIKVSCVVFADDTIIFCDNDCEQMLSLQYILIWFKVVTTMKVNLTKNSTLPIGQVPITCRCTVDLFLPPNLASL